MKARMIRVGSPVILSVLILLGGCVTQPNKQLYYGTWTSESGYVRKSVHSPDGFIRDYTSLSDSTPFQVVREEVNSSWSDSQGNVWLKTSATVISGPNKDVKVQTLTKISRAGKLLEVMWTQVPDFGPESFPTRIDPSDNMHYWSFNRAEK